MFDYYHNLTLGYGFDIPINVSLEYPSVVEPGDNVSLNISVEKGGAASFFSRFYGPQRLYFSMEFGFVYNDSEYSVNLTIGFDIDYCTNITLEIPRIMGLSEINETNYSTTVSNTKAYFKVILVNGSETHQYELDVSLTSTLTFDVYAILDAIINGRLSIEGSALEQSVIKNITWDKPEWKTIWFKIKDDATSNDDVSISVDLNYTPTLALGIIDNIMFNTTVNEAEIDTELNDIVDEIWGEILENIIEDIIDAFVEAINDILEEIVVPIFIPTTTMLLRTKSSENKLETSPPYDEYTISIDETIGVQAKTGWGSRISRFTHYMEDYWQLFVPIVVMAVVIIVLIVYFIKKV